MSLGGGLRGMGNHRNLHWKLGSLPLVSALSNSRFGR
jgi:hypothetical protein